MFRKFISKIVAASMVAAFLCLCAPEAMAADHGAAIGFIGQDQMILEVRGTFHVRNHGDDGWKTVAVNPEDSLAAWVVADGVMFWADTSSVGPRNNVLTIYRVSLDDVPEFGKKKDSIDLNSQTLDQDIRQAMMSPSTRIASCPVEPGWGERLLGMTAKEGLVEIYSYGEAKGVINRKVWQQHSWKTETINVTDARKYDFVFKVNGASYLADIENQKLWSLEKKRRVSDPGFVAWAAEGKSNEVDADQAVAKIIDAKENLKIAVVVATPSPLVLFLEGDHKQL